MGKKLKICGVAFALTGFMAAAAQAQSNPVVLPQVVISPTQIPTPSDHVASSVSVVTAADIERDQRRSVPDVLNSLPGLNVVQTGGPGGQASIFIRGTNSNHVKVLIDGIDVSDPSTPNRTFDFGHLQTFDIEQVEVLRGPQSGLYGADAIGGVISITTKKGEGPPKVRALVEGGSFGTFNQAAGVSGSMAAVNYALNVSHMRSADVPVTPDRLLPPGRAAIGNSYENSTASARIGADISKDFSVSWVGRYTDSNLFFTGTDFPAPAFIGVPSAQQSQGVTHQFFTRGEAVWSVFDGRLKNHFGAAYTDIWSWNKTPTAAATTYQGTRDKYDWRGDIALAPGHVLLLGAESETERLNTAGLSRQNGNTGVYAEIQSEFAKRFFVVANARHDNNERFGPYSTYRVAPAIIVPVTDTKLKASYGTGFKAPSLSQLYQNFPPFFSANPNLLPEKSRGYDAGFEQPLFNNRVRFGVTYFNNDIEDLINCNTFCTTVINIGRARTYGTESFVAWTVTDRLRVRADYTHTIAYDVTTGFDLTRRPKDKASVQTVWQPIDPLTLSATVLWVSSWVDVDRAGVLVRPVSPGYTTVNVAANYAVNPHATVFGRIDNLFNQHYEDPNGYLQPGLGIYAGIRVNN